MWLNQESMSFIMASTCPIALLPKGSKAPGELVGGEGKGKVTVLLKGNSR